MSKAKLSKNKIRLIVFACMAGLLLGMAIFADYVCPYDPYEQNFEESLEKPSINHLMGTDRFGRDMLSRIIVGGRVSILSTLSLVMIITVFGTTVGILCGYIGGKFDSIVMRICDLFLAFPGLVFALALASVLQGGIVSAVFALALISWPKYARIARSQTLVIKNMPYIHSAIFAGDSSVQIIFRHIIPNVAGQIIVTAMLDIGTLMMELAGLSFLGLGAQSPTAEWGSMMSGGRSMLQTHPWLVLSPGLAIFVTVAVFNLLGDSVRDYLNPHKINNFKI
ncbi:MAG: ABC transporter permease [Treponemataceae bacterium]|nr:ABC transporter permease [Treponemataceae bacterium]